MAATLWYTAPMFQWILSVIESTGYLGIFFLMILENVFPPIPSEVVIPLAGFAAAEGELHLAGVIIAAILGGIIGCIPWYILGYVFGLNRLKQLSTKYGRLMTLNAEDIDRAQEWFLKHGHMAVFFGRLMPTVRSLISVPAGIAHMKFWTFLWYSFLGTSIWTLALLFSGYVLQSQYEKISVYVDFISNAIIIAIVALYLYRVITFKHSKPEK